jgi:SPP1 gp7 family putative phage head morphogenesis protein
MTTATLFALKPEDAIKALTARGSNLDPSFAWQDVYAEEHAQGFTVAKSAGFDILGDIFKALQKALEEGRTFRDFAKELTPLLQNKGWWGRQLVDDPASGERKVAQLGSTRRLQLIFDANLRVSYAAGHWANFERGKAGRPWLRYVCILDDRTRPEHRKRHNLCLPVDHPYWDKWAPPCGWHCRCTLQSLSDRDVERMRKELIFTPPEDDDYAFTNKRTGEIRMIPNGIDPGWDHNPGKAGFAVFDALEKLAAAPPAFAAKANQDLRWLIKPYGPEFEKWFDQAAAGGRVERSTVVAGFLDSPVIQALKDRGTEPISGAITVQQGTVVHMVRDLKAQAGKTVSPDILKQIPAILNAPRAVLIDRRDGTLIYVFDASPDPRLGKLAVKIDYADKARPPGGKPQTIRTNSIRTAGLVNVVTLADPATYDVIFGSL